MPHDANNSNPQTGTNAYVTIKRLGMRVKPPMQRTDPEARIKAARMMFPRIYIDNSDFSKRRQTGWLGCARLLECLRHYRRNVPQTTGEPGSPKHDEFSHGCDALGATAEVVDQIADEFNQDLAPMLTGSTIYDPGVGPMG